MTVSQALALATATLAQGGVAEARLDAEYLLAHVCVSPRLLLRASGVSALSPAREQRFFALVARRAAREPLQYILGEQEFMGHAFACAPCALIPRMDTETLCEQALMRMCGDERVLDLCTGTGALAISVKLAFPHARVFASDVSDDALALARANAERLCADVTFFAGDLLAPFAGDAFDVILCNPPYIPTRELPCLQEEVRREPELALDGGEDGLAFYRRLAKDAPPVLRAGGHLLCEFGDGQADAVRALFSPLFASVRIVRDLAGLARVIVCRKEA